MDSSETVAGLLYTLWAQPDCSWWLGWLVWLVRWKGSQKGRCLPLSMSRLTIRVYVVPLERRRTAPARQGVGARNFGTPVPFLIVIEAVSSLNRDICQPSGWLGSSMVNISVH